MRAGNLRQVLCFLAPFPFGIRAKGVPLWPLKVAQMVELVDTRDLKSLGHCGRTGSIPVPGTRTKEESSR